MWRAAWHHLLHWTKLSHTPFCLGLLSYKPSDHSPFGMTPQARCTKPLAHSWPSPPPPGNCYLFLACVGSLLSTAADRLYLAGFNELRVADVRLGSTFFLHVCVCLGLACFLPLCSRMNSLPLPLRLCALVCGSALTSMCHANRCSSLCTASLLCSGCAQF